MKKHFKIFFAFLLVSLFGALNASAAFNNMYVFGDSFSDVGNFPFSGAYSYGGRFTNGLVFNEYLANTLISKNLLNGNVPTNSDGGNIADGHTNFAYGGARSAADLTIGTTTIPSAYNQITGDIIATGSAGEPSFGFAHYNRNFGDNDLALLGAGINDYNFAVAEIKTDYDSLQTLAKNAVANVKLCFDALVDYGAKNIVFWNYMDTSTSPAVGADEKPYMSFYISAFNAELDAIYSDLISQYADVNFYYLDFYSEFEKIAADPEAYGFTITDDYVKNSDGSNQDAYLWYDIHPSTKIAEYLADYAYAVINPIPEPAEIAFYFSFLGLVFVALKKVIRRAFCNGKS